MRVDLYPLEKIVMEGKELCLGCDMSEAVEMLGKPEAVEGDDVQRHYYFDSELALDFNEDDELEYIEFLGGHDGELKPYIYGVSAFDTDCDELVDILTENNDGEVDDGEDDSYGFLGSSVGIWKEDGDDEYWSTIGIGVEGYYE